jgi:adenosylhomocysteine nucleosidase
MRRIAIMAASGRELAPARAALGNIRDGRLHAFRHEVGETGAVEVHLIETGIGPEAAYPAARVALDVLAVDAVVSTGYAGALGSAGLGGLILGTEVRNWTKGNPHTRFRGDPALLAIARDAAGLTKTAWSQGALVTVENVVWRTTEKQALGTVSGAIAVDMESAAIAQAAGERGVPFLLVRAVSDRADEDLPMDFNLWFTPWGRVQGAVQIFLHPSILRSLLRMKRHVEQGSQNLARFFKAFFVVLDEGRLPADALTVTTMGAH